MMRIAVFTNPNEVDSPSNRKALRLFVEAGIELGVEVKVVGLEDMESLSSYDGLFLRATTSSKDGTYYLSILAQKMGLIVIDNPESILCCGNKVLQARIFKSRKINYLPTKVLNNYVDFDKLEVQYPCVLKDPSSGFSRGVKKADDLKELKSIAIDLFSETNEILLQPFMPTEYDWRIGIIDNKVIYACKYYMAKGHWQIYNWSSKKDVEGKTESIPIDLVPKNVLKLALKATKCISDGFYGVDIKVFDDVPYIVEVNDNPSIDHSLEDQILGRDLYVNIIKVFKRRIRKQRRDQS